MRKVKIITDSCADLSGALLKKYDIDYVKMSTVLDGVESPALLTWSNAEMHEFFEKIRSGKRITTAQVSTGEFEKVFGRYLSNGYDIVYIACSSKQSGSVNTGKIIAQKLLPNYPGAKIFCIDSLNASIGEGMLAIEAAKMLENVQDAEEIASYITGIRKNVREFVTVHTLDYLKRAGRVTASSAFFGNLMGVKPILVSDVNGAQTAVKKVKGRQNSIREVVTMLKGCIKDPEKQTVYIVHSDASQAEIELLKNMVKQEINCKDIIVGTIGPIIGASVGPDSLGVFAFGEKETFCASDKN